MTGIWDFIDIFIEIFVTYLLCMAGVWGIGLASRQVDLNQVPMGRDKLSWVLRQDNIFSHNNEQCGKLTQQIEEGDVIVSSYGNWR